MPSTPQVNIDSVLTENRVFECSEEFRSQAYVKSMAEYERIYREAEADPEKFWGEIASQLHWFKPWNKVREWDCPWAKWFTGGEINLSYNCLDRHVATWRRNKAALIWEGEPGEVADPHLPAASAGSLQVRQRLKVAGSEEGRPRGHLHGDVPRAAYRHAGVRAHRRAAHCGLRRLLGQRAGGSHHRFPGLLRDHAGRLVPARRRGEAQARGGRSAAFLPVGEERTGVPANRNASNHVRRARPLVARTGTQGV